MVAFLAIRVSPPRGWPQSLVKPLGPVKPGLLLTFERQGSKGTWIKGKFFGALSAHKVPPCAASCRCYCLPFRNGIVTCGDSPPGARKSEEVPMFEMIKGEKPGPEERRLFCIKLVAFIVALAVAAGVIYLFAVGYLR